MSERVCIIADGRKVYSGRDYARALRLRDKHWPGARAYVTKQHGRDFLVDQGFGFRTVRWSAWREPRPKVLGYGSTEQEAIEDLVENVQPLDELEVVG